MLLSLSPALLDSIAQLVEWRFLALKALIVWLELKQPNSVP